MRKKLLLLSLSFCMVIGMSGCKKTEESHVGKSEDKVSTETEAPTESSANVSDEDSQNEVSIVNDNGEVVDSQENPGESVMVSNKIVSDYFSSAKATREQTRAKNMETLMKIINNESLNSDDKKAAVQEVAEITQNAQKESDAEMMLEAKGFKDALVSIDDGKADVVVNAETLTAKQMAQIVDIVKRKTSVPAEDIVLTPVSTSKN